MSAVNRLPPPTAHRPLSSVSRLLASAFCLVLAACGAIPTPAGQQADAFPSPVAYVTAAPLPEATAIPTAPPLATLTAAPATSIPRREPQVSTNAIGLWNSRLNSGQSYPGFLDIAVGTGASDYRTQSNQLLLALTSEKVSTGLGANITDVLKSNASWVLYDKNKRLARGANGEPLLDIRTDAVVTSVVDAIATASAGYDGVMISDVGNDLIRVNNTPMFTGTKAFTEQQRRDAVEVLVRAIRVRLRDKVVIIGGYAWRDGTVYGARPGEALDVSALVDGVHIEAFARNPISNTKEFKTETNWKRDIDMLAELSKDNRIVMVSTSLGAADAGPDLARQWLNFGLASYLLGKSGAHTYFNFDPGSPAFASDPLLSAPLGAPTEAYVKLEGGLYSRKFERGLVLVNPTGEAKKTTLEGGYRTLAGNPVDVSVALSEHTGLILLKQ